MKITYAAATSRDGFIATEQGDVGWLDEMDIDPSETDLEAFMASVDGLVMGRGTYDFIFNYGSWPYESKPCWVCTSNTLVPLDGANLTVVDDIDLAIVQAEQKQLKHLWLVGGGKLASAFLDKGLITHLSVSEMPVDLHRGIALFANHSLEDIPFSNRAVVERTKYNQIEMKIATDSDLKV